MEFQNLYRQNFCRYLQQVLQKKKKTHFLPKLTYDGQILPYEKEVRFLGMLFDHRLAWAAHIKELTQRCQKDLNQMKLVSGTNFGADKIILIRLYTSLISSKIDHGCQAYGSAANSHFKKLDTIQATALRIATGAYKGTQTLSLEVKCNILPLQKRKDDMTLEYWARSASLGSKLPINSRNLNQFTQPVETGSTGVHHTT